MSRDRYVPLNLDGPWLLDGAVRADVPEIETVYFFQGVYFVQCQSFIKIGIANNVKERLCGLRAAVPFDVVPLGWIQFHSRVELIRKEIELHERFAAHRRRPGEWFHEHAELRAFIVSHAQAWPE